MRASTSFSLILSLFGSLMTNCAFGDPEEETSEASHVAATVVDCSRMVEQLVHPSRSPQLKLLDDKKTHGLDVEFPQGYDESAIGKIAHAYNELSKNIEVALPVLVEHADDCRYSYTYENPNGAWFNDTVGHLCRRIIVAEICLYLDYARPYTRTLPGSLVREADDVKFMKNIWWPAHKGRSLRDLQLEYLRWALKAEKEVGNFESDAERLRVVGELEKAISQLENSKSPIVRQLKLYVGEK